MRNKKKLVLSIVTCLFAIFFISCINATKEEVINDVKAGNYQQVLEDIHGLNTTERVQVQRVAVEKISYIVQEAENNKITYSQAVDELNFVKKIVPKNDENKVNKAIEYIKGLDQQKNVK
ncbi:hypothetical protein [uncultured Clostridium sp.]|uniref:hypothetical protein n=1 Tax=uncultured Clostridium sp. TaxID=59620 RepID=UPI002602C949|nr:hypothetical protein [uncultured Clostridium sp.]